MQIWKSENNDWLMVAAENRLNQQHACTGPSLPPCLCVLMPYAVLASSRVPLWPVPILSCFRCVLAARKPVPVVVYTAKPLQ